MFPLMSDYHRQTPAIVEQLEAISGRWGFVSPLTNTVGRRVRALDKWSERRGRPLFGHPGWLNPRTLSAFFKFRGESVPFRQTSAFDGLLRVNEFHQSIGAVSLLSKGTLLGAVRQGAFAGRPFDIDLYVIYQKGIDAYLSALHEAGRSYRIVEARHKCTTFGPAKLRLRASIRVDVQVLVHNPVDSGTLYADRVLPRSKFAIVWPGLSTALTAQVFGREYFIPSNYIDLLEQWYGPNWKEPTSRQFSVRTPRVSKPITGRGEYA